MLWNFFPIVYTTYLSGWIYMVLFLLLDKIGNDEIGCVLAREGALIKPGRRRKHLHNPAMTIDRTVKGGFPVSDIVEKAAALVEELYAENPRRSRV